MSNEPTPDSVQALAVSTTVHVLHALAEDRLQNLGLDYFEYLADLYCLDRIANMLGIQFALSGPSELPSDATVVDHCRRISFMLKEAYDRRGVEPVQWCLNHERGMLQRHPGTASGG